MKKAQVAIAKSPKDPTDKEIETTVKEAVNLVGGLPSKIGSGDTVIIKPNIVLPKPPGHVANTDPRVCIAIADLVKEKGARPIIAESSGVGIDTEESIQESGYLGGLHLGGVVHLIVSIPQSQNNSSIFISYNTRS